MSEIRVGVRDLKSRLSEYLRQVKHGHTVIITEHGHPVGRLLPVEQSLDDRLKALQNAGMVAWNGQKLKSVTSPVINRGEQQVSDILVEMRE
jgi:prevent-host-death family protein